MKDQHAGPLVFKSIAQLMLRIGGPEPSNPLIGLIDYDAMEVNKEDAGRLIITDFYKISFKKKFNGQVGYGQGYYDFRDGGLAFLTPNQVVTMSGDERSYDGRALFFHPDLIRNYQLGRVIKKYGFFAYSVSEALFLSEEEKKVILSIFDNIAAELKANKDHFSQDILVSQIELLLNYSNRFYDRQFAVQKAIHSDTVAKIDTYLSERFAAYGTLDDASVQDVVAHLGVSQRYLTDMLKSLTGRSTQQYIQN